MELFVSVVSCAGSNRLVVDMVPHLLSMEVADTAEEAVDTEEEVALLHLNMEAVDMEEEVVDTKINRRVTVPEATVTGSCSTISNLKEATEVEATEEEEAMVNPPMVLVNTDKARPKDLMEDTSHQEVGMAAIQACLDCKRALLSRQQGHLQNHLLFRPLNRLNPVLRPPKIHQLHLLPQLIRQFQCTTPQLILSVVMEEVTEVEVTEVPSLTIKGTVE